MITKCLLKVPLVAALTAYKELRADDTLTILIPHQPLFPMSRIHVPVFLQPQVGQNVAVFIVRYLWKHPSRQFHFN